MRYKMCSRNYCDYNSYYKSQVGGNSDIIYYPGSKYQRGSGRISNLARRYGIPALRFLLKQGWNVGKDLYSDLSKGKDFTPSLKTSLRKRGADIFKDISEKMSQPGKGLRKKPRMVKKRKIRRKKLSRKPSAKKKSRKRKSKSKPKYRKILKSSDIFNNGS
jgi:hypothetical protein